MVIVAGKANESNHIHFKDFRAKRRICRVPLSVNLDLDGYHFHEQLWIDRSRLHEEPNPLHTPFVSHLSKSYLITLSERGR